ncbi:DUF6737 family protein [Cyanobacterium sp. uoEpiScrs1]|uniref:DUF6737 family protein n=1 Tax=Cyanobacterium sp. uoEpiScrs1 TaxID=2976343 RepID=UPI002269F50B|nr:DUF6737 family protein [Cyanobacterium sp. uoEpiScrs1]
MSVPPTIDIWKYKPWWCQPWTILLTGTGVILGNWLLFHKIWLIAVTSSFVLIWWFYFLVFIPNLFKQQGLNQEQ